MNISELKRHFKKFSCMDKPSKGGNFLLDEDFKHKKFICIDEPPRGIIFELHNDFFVHKPSRGLTFALHEDFKTFSSVDTPSKGVTPVSKYFVLLKGKNLLSIDTKFARKHFKKKLSCINNTSKGNYSSL